MSRYSEISGRAFNRLPERLKTPFTGRFIVFALVASVAIGLVLIGGLVVFLGDLAHGTAVDGALEAAFWGAIGAATATLLALVVIPFIRDGLGLAEDIRLLEAASPAHPLMRELIMKAPGTYAHSVATANLAESAAEALGADALVTRVGSYFHDIGKIKRPLYFFENQSGGLNPHDEAKPSLSALIITAHVQDGMVLAEQYNLPVKVREIVRQHHGTSLVRYFYNKAAALDAAVFEADFRYQGERPTSREAALVMLADSSEAAVRALREPTQPRIEALVRALAADKTADHQLENSGLTPEDVEQVVSIYSHILVSMYHARCEYPPAPDQTERTPDADPHHQPSRA
jgi:putative nucleotidyltransferase with HDIG domain